MGSLGRIPLRNVDKYSLFNTEWRPGNSDRQRCSDNSKSPYYSCLPHYGTIENVQLTANLAFQTMRRRYWRWSRDQNFALLYK